MGIERTPRQIEDEFMITSVSILRNGDHLPPDLVDQHAHRLQHAQSFFDRYGLSLDQTLNMPQQEFEMFVGMIIQE
jgi:hypothetical protein